MTNEEYRAEIAALGLSQVGAAKVLGIGERTSRRYASQGVPERLSPYIAGKLADLKTIQQDTGLSAQASICKAIEDKAERIRRKS